MEKTCGSCKWGGCLWGTDHSLRRCDIPTPAAAWQDIHLHVDKQPCPLWEPKEEKPQEYRPENGPFFALKGILSIWWDVFCQQGLGHWRVFGGVSASCAKVEVDRLNRACCDWVADHGYNNWQDADQWPCQIGFFVVRTASGDTLLAWYGGGERWLLANTPGDTEAIISGVDYWLKVPE